MSISGPRCRMAASLCSVLLSEGILVDMDHLNVIRSFLDHPFIMFAAGAMFFSFYPSWR